MFGIHQTFSDSQLLPIPTIPHFSFYIPNTRRRTAIDVPVACAAGFEEFFVIAFKKAWFLRYCPISTESVLITAESNWIQTLYCSTQPDRTDETAKRTE
jgi:hypothetical protein